MASRDEVSGNLVSTQKQRGHIKWRRRRKKRAKRKKRNDVYDKNKTVAKVANIKIVIKNNWNIVNDNVPDIENLIKKKN